MELVSELAKFIISTDFTSIPKNVLDITKERLLDTLGAMYASCSGWEYTKQLYEACLESGRGEGRILGFPGKGVPYPIAALANSALAHAVELDDGHKNAGCHAGASVVPTALMLGAALRSTSQEILTAIVLGYDVEYRIATNVTPAQIDKFFHPSTACAVYGAVATAGKLLGLTVEQLANGLGLAGAFSSGIEQARKGAPDMKGIMVGNAVSNGINAALMAKAGLVGPLKILEGSGGVFEVMSENVDADNVIKDFGVHFLICDTYTKLYPACRHSHPAIEGVLALLAEGLQPCDVTDVEIGCYRVAFEATASNYTPQNAGEAKFSTPYCVAVSMREGGIGLRHLTDAAYLGDPELLTLARKVRVLVDPDIEKMFPKVRGSRVTFKLTNGESRTTTVIDLKGSPALPVSWTDLTEKFRANAASVISEETVTECIALIDGFDEKNKAEDLFKLIF